MDHGTFETWSRSEAIALLAVQHCKACDDPLTASIDRVLGLLDLESYWQGQGTYLINFGHTLFWEPLTIYPMFFSKSNSCGRWA